jgi:hypothetical protein
LNRAASTVPGFASSVTSAPGSSGRRARTPDRIWSIDPGEKRLGVPPPMKTLDSRRPHTDGSIDSRSAIRRATYSRSGNSPERSREPLGRSRESLGRSCELKSQ